MCLELIGFSLSTLFREKIVTILKWKNRRLCLFRPKGKRLVFTYKTFNFPLTFLTCFEELDTSYFNIFSTLILSPL